MVFQDEGDVGVHVRACVGWLLACVSVLRLELFFLMLLVTKQHPLLTGPFYKTRAVH